MGLGPPGSENSRFIQFSQNVESYLRRCIVFARSRQVALTLLVIHLGLSVADAALFFHHSEVTLRLWPRPEARPEGSRVPVSTPPGSGSFLPEPEPRACATG